MPYLTDAYGNLLTDEEGNILFDEDGVVTPTYVTASSLRAADVVARVRGTLIDADGTRWTDAEILGWLSDGLRTILAVRPDVYSTTTTVALNAGSKQTLGFPAYLLLRVFRNIQADGSPGRAVRIASREVLDAQNPDWHAAAQTDAVQNYIYDSSMLATFFVYPPNTGNGRLEVLYAPMPESITVATDPLPLPDIWIIPLVDYVLFRAYMKDSDNPAAPQLANTYMSSFAQFVGAAGQGKAATDINLALQPGDGPAGGRP